MHVLCACTIDSFNFLQGVCGGLRSGGLGRRPAVGSWEGNRQSGGKQAALHVYYPPAHPAMRHGRTEPLSTMCDTQRTCEAIK